MSEVNPGPSSDLNLAQYLRYFIHLTSQAPLETVCNSALHLLTRVPSTRKAVIEYIGTFYKITSFIYLRFNLNQKNPNYNDLQTDIKNINQINQVIDSVDSSLCDLLEKSENNEFWSIELCPWLVELIGDISQNSGITFAESQGLLNEEAAFYKSPNISDSLEIWSNQCRPTKSILFILQKCFTSVPSSTKLILTDFILNTSTKYGTKYDWVLCYLSPFDTELLFEKLLFSGLKEFLSFNHSESTDQQLKLSRINAINFFTLNYPDLIYQQLEKFIQYANNDKKLFLLRLFSQTPALLNIIINKILDNYNQEDLIKQEFYSGLVNNDNSFISELFNCIKQINNSIAVFDIMTNALDWLINQDYSNLVNDQNFKTIQEIITNFIDDMIKNIYMINNENFEKEKVPPSEQIPFLKSLNNINSFSFNLLVKKLISIIDSFDRDTFIFNYDLIYKLILLILKNSDSNYANLLFAQLLKISFPNNTNSSSSSSSSETFLNNMRLEVSPFHVEILQNSIKAVIQSFKTSEYEDNNILAFIKNLVMFYEWDKQNQFYITQNLSTILIQSECFIGLLNHLKINENYSFLTIELYNKIFKTYEKELESLKLNISDILSLSNFLVKYFFDLTESINEENVHQRTDELNEMILLIKNLLSFQYNNQDENNPFRNIFLRNLIDKLFELLKLKKINKDDLENVDYFDENSNLFNKNIDIINTEIITNKSRLKAVRKSLIEHPVNKLEKRQQKVQFKSIKNFAIMEIIKTICSKSSDSKQNFESKLFNEQLSNLSDLIVQNILLDHHIIDYQWPGSSHGDLDDNFENEVEAIKLFIERDVAVQNMVENPNDNQAIWLLLEFIAIDEQAFIKLGPIIRSLLASLIIQWESYQEQSTRNIPKKLGLTMRLLNLINRVKKVPNLLQKPFCYIVDLIPLLNSYETHILLLIIWKNLKKKMSQSSKTPAILNELNKNIELKQLRYIFHKNIGKLAYLYSKFFQISLN